MCKALLYSTLPLCLLASGCAPACAPSVRTEFVERGYPAALFDCAAPPDISEGPLDADVLRDLARVTAAYESCKRAIEIARGRVRTTGN